MDEIGQPQNRTVELITEGLVHAAGMAYVEDAPGTATIIQSMDRLVRYLFKKSDWVSLQDELSALQSYAVLQTSRFHNDIHICPYVNTGLFVKSTQLVAFVDQCYLLQLQKGGEFELQISLQMTQSVAKGPQLLLLVDAVGQNQQCQYQTILET